MMDTTALHMRRSVLFRRQRHLTHIRPDRKNDLLVGQQKRPPIRHRSEKGDIREVGTPIYVFQKYKMILLRRFGGKIGGATRIVVELFCRLSPCLTLRHLPSTMCINHKAS